MSEYDDTMRLYLGRLRNNRRRPNKKWCDEYDQLAANLGYPDLLIFSLGGPSELKLSQIKEICAYVDQHGKQPIRVSRLGHHLNNIMQCRKVKWHDEYDQLAANLGYPDLLKSTVTDGPSELRLGQIRAICAYIDQHGKPPISRSNIGSKLFAIKTARYTKGYIWYDEYDQLAAELGYPSLLKPTSINLCEFKLNHIREICTYIDQHGYTPYGTTPLGKKLVSLKQSRKNNSNTWFNEYDQLAADLGHPGILIQLERQPDVPSEVYLKHITNICLYIDEHAKLPHHASTLGIGLTNVKKLRSNPKGGGRWFNKYDQLAAELGHPDLLKFNRKNTHV